VNTVILVAPLIVFALVLLLGFTGCRLDAEGKGPGPPTDGDPGDGDGDGEGPPPVPYADEVMSSNPIAYWRLSDPPGSSVAKDEIGAPPSGDHPGAYQGSWTLGQPPGLNESDPVATPARFDGIGHVEVAHDPMAFEMSQFTVEALVHPDSVVARCVVVGSMASSLIVGGGWQLAIVPPSAGDHPDIDGFFAPVVSDGSGPASGPPPVAFDFAKLGTAWHLAITYDGMVFTLYWDGVKVDWGTWPYVPNTQDPIQIGLDFKGAIQEVAVYGVALTPEQIGTHYLANASPGP
jgi:hypothetical protein